ncbi:hypothetical protein CEB3_c11230 [Peptococcaceae bacterium CEB3]|nr:hypothetical protein CEB3_c11230 [Peptococcaceae bacterium CEB3]
MLEKGICAFAGLGYSPEQNSRYLRLARECGFTRLFTSLQIPEAKVGNLEEEFRLLVAEAARLGFQTTADISPATFNLLEVDLSRPEQLHTLGLQALRLDFGFSPAEIARLSKESGLELDLNASTISEDVLEAIMGAGADSTRLRACHNYYPRPETGLSYEFFAERTQICHTHGIRVSAFIPSRANPRGPIYAGLPTLEAHRHWEPLQAAKQLAAEGLEGILFGDPLATAEELTEVGRVDSSLIEIQVKTKPGLTENERKILFAPRHTNRPDPGERVARSQEARGLCREEIPAHLQGSRPRGSVTLDNSGYRRYMGELQVVMKDLPADPRVNVVAKVIPEEMFLLDALKPGRAFCFKEKTEKRVDKG